MTSRNPWLDQVKGIACLLIVSHHLAFYGPMADVLEPFFGRTLSWFREYARMALQVFLVVGGYLSAAALAPQGCARQGSLLRTLGKRYVRLVVPYTVCADPYHCDYRLDAWGLYFFGAYGLGLMAWWAAHLTNP